MSLNLSKRIKNHPTIFIILKSYFNFKLASKYLKAFERIKNLDLIDFNNYLNIHKDCKDENLNPIIHYLYYGKNDNLDEKKLYITNFFNIDFYKKTYLVDYNTDPLIDYVLNGFFKNYFINPLDKGYIKNFNDSAVNQYNRNLNKMIQDEINNNFYITDIKLLIPFIESSNNFKTDKIRVGVFTNDSFKNLAPCSYIRIHKPFKELSKSKKFNFFMYGMDSYHFMNLDEILKEKIFDIVVVQRILPFLDTFLEKCLKNNIKIIYETDDDLLAVEENSPSFEYVNRCRNEINNFINNSDVVTVSTPELAKRFNKNKVNVIRNYYLSSLLPIKKEIKKGGKFKIGYFGTLTHTKDLFLIKDVIIELKERFNQKHGIDFDFEVIGGFNAEDNIDENWYNNINLPPDSMNFEKFMEWLPTVTNWDIGIAPLDDSYFNNGKSELKYIEFTALGIPGVYSDVKVYNSVIENGFNGFLARDKEDWILKLEKLILDEKLREDILINATKDILNNYSLADRVNTLEKILLDLNNI